MKTLVILTQNILKSVLVLLVATLSFNANASDGIVPAKATLFTAAVNTTNNTKVDLKWSTEIETGLSHFIVERSVDGINFSNAALVFAYGNTTSKSDYAFADNITRVLAGAVYYRIISIGADGTNLSSEIRIIKTNK